MQYKYNTLRDAVLPIISGFKSQSSRSRVSLNIFSVSTHCPMSIWPIHIHIATNTTHKGTSCEKMKGQGHTVVWDFVVSAPFHRACLCVLWDTNTTLDEEALCCTPFSGQKVNSKGHTGRLNECRVLFSGQKVKGDGLVGRLKLCRARCWSSASAAAIRSPDLLFAVKDFFNQSYEL